MTDTQNEENIVRNGTVLGKRKRQFSEQEEKVTVDISKQHIEEIKDAAIESRVSEVLQWAIHRNKSGEYLLDLSLEKLDDKLLSFVLEELSKTGTEYVAIKMFKNNINELGIESLLKFMQGQKAVKQLDLTSNPLEGKSYQLLAEYLKEDKALVSLRISDCSTEQLQRLAMGVKENKTLKSLSISNSVPADGLKILMEALTNGGLEKLSLNAELDALDTEGLLTCLPSTHIRYLDLSDNSFSGVSLKKLCEALSASGQIRSLLLPRNFFYNIGEEIRGLFDDSIGLKLLDLSENTIDSEAIKFIAEGIVRNHTIESLVLTDASLVKNDFVTLLESLKSNNTIKRLDLSGSRLMDEEIISIITEFNHEREEKVHFKILRANAGDMGYEGLTNEAVKVIESLDLIEQRYFIYELTTEQSEMRNLVGVVEESQDI